MLQVRATAYLAIFVLGFQLCPAAESGQVDARTFTSKQGEQRKVWVYTPPRFVAARTPPYDLLIAFDGDMQMEDMQLPATLDRLHNTRAVASLVAVMIDNSANRIGELANNKRFADLLAGEILPWIRQNWNVTRDPQHTIVTGASAGGLAAANLAFHRPDLFGNVIAQSGAFWRGNEGDTSEWEWLTRQVAQSARKPVRFYIEVGALETRPVLGKGPIFIEANRRFRDALKAKGYDVTYSEVPGANHSPEHWRTQIGPAIVALTATWPKTE